MPYPEAKILSDLRVSTKIRGYVSAGKESWLKHEANGLIKHKCKGIGTRTHRVAHMEPNLGQIPSDKGGPFKKELGKRCRKLFKPKDGFIMVGVDLSSIELRVLAHYLSKVDGGLYAKIMEEGDPHENNKVAAGLATRDEAKIFIYAWLYGCGVDLTAGMLGLGPEETKAVRESFLKKTKGLERLKRAIEAKVLTGGFKSLDGRHIECDSGHKALNYLLQSSAAIIAKRWMLLVHKNMEALGYTSDDWEQYAFCHDELVLGAKPEVADVLLKVCKDSVHETAEYYNLNVKLDSEGAKGESWFDIH
jgi:DNA polymerase I-like protein with 3'-5' exonuclease and polymerase domains